jgi:hypothetical protein
VHGNDAGCEGDSDCEQDISERAIPGRLDPTPTCIGQDDCGDDKRCQSVGDGGGYAGHRTRSPLSQGNHLGRVGSHNTQISGEAPSLAQASSAASVCYAASPLGSMR